MVISFLPNFLTQKYVKDKLTMIAGFFRLGLFSSFFFLGGGEVGVAELKFRIQSFYKFGVDISGS